MKTIIQKLQEEYKNAKYEYDRVDKYIEEFDELPETKWVDDLFEAWYLRWIEVALWIVKTNIWK